MLPAAVPEGRAQEVWPSLPLDAWRDTYATLHMWTQVVGKICLALTPLTNHFWNIAFHVTSRGWCTHRMNVAGLTMTMAFDFIDHQLVIQVSDGRTERVPLEPRSVADFYRGVVDPPLHSETLRRRTGFDP